MWLILSYMNLAPIDLHWLVKPLFCYILTRNLGGMSLGSNQLINQQKKPPKNKTPRWLIWGYCLFAVREEFQKHGIEKRYTFPLIPLLNLRTSMKTLWFGFSLSSAWWEATIALDPIAHPCFSHHFQCVAKSLKPRHIPILGAANITRITSNSFVFFPLNAI